MLPALLVVVAMSSGSTSQFTVDGVVTRSSTAIVTVEPRSGAPPYSWLRIYFYSSPLTSDDSASAARGRIEAIKARRSAVLQLTIDAHAKVWQVDVSVPGHMCTIAESHRAAENVLQDFEFDGKHVRIRGKGSHVCRMSSPGVPDRSFKWDIDVDALAVQVG
jgi:hypothetical protein